MLAIIGVRGSPEWDILSLTVMGGAGRGLEESRPGRRRGRHRPWKGGILDREQGDSGPRAGGD